MTNTAENQVSLDIQVANLDNEEAQTTSARTLHTKLGVKKKFTDWIKDQIERFGFVEGKDFEMQVQKGAAEAPAGVPPRGHLKSLEQARTEYQVTIDAAKTISVNSLTEKGREIREYLLAVEKDFKALKKTLELADRQKFERDTEHRMKLEYSAEASAIRGTSPTYDIGRKLIQSSKKMKPGKPWPPEVIEAIQMAQRQAKELQRLLESFDPDSVVDFEDDHVYANIEFEIKNAHRLQVSREGTPRLKH